MILGIAPGPYKIRIMATQWVPGLPNSLDACAIIPVRRITDKSIRWGNIDLLSRDDLSDLAHTHRLAVAFSWERPAIEELAKYRYNP